MLERADALGNEYIAVATYNINLVSWRYFRGTIEAELDCVGMPEHARAAARRTVRNERKRAADAARTEAASLDAPTLPELWKCFPPLREEPRDGYLHLEVAPPCVIAIPPNI